MYITFAISSIESTSVRSVKKKKKKFIKMATHKVLLIVKRFAARFTIPGENKTALNQTLSETTRAHRGQTLQAAINSCSFLRARKNEIRFLCDSSRVFASSLDKSPRVIIIRSVSSRYSSFTSTRKF